MLTTEQKREKSREYNRRYRERLGEQYNLYHREYRRGILLSLPKKNKQTDAEKKIIRNKYMQKYRKKNAQKIKARSILNNAVYAGKIIRPKQCSSCPFRGLIEADHSDYNQPLLVTWLCKRCHMRIEKLRRGVV